MTGAAAVSDDVRERHRLDEGQRSDGTGVVPADRLGAVGDRHVERQLVADGRTGQRQVDDGLPAAGLVVDDARDVARTIAVEDEGRVVDDERRRVGGLRGGVGDLDIRRQVIRLPAELEPDGVVAEPMERQLLPCERIGRVRVERDTALEDERGTQPGIELAIDRPEVRGLGLEVGIEQEWRARGSPAAAVVQAPQRHREQVGGVGAEDPEGIAVVVALVDELGGVDRRAGRHVHLADDLGHRQVLERGDRLLERPDRRRQAEVELVADRVDRDAAIEQALDEVVRSAGACPTARCCSR